MGGKRGVREGRGWKKEEVERRKDWGRREGGRRSRTQRGRKRPGFAFNDSGRNTMVEGSFCFGSSESVNFGQHKSLSAVGPFFPPPPVKKKKNTRTYLYCIYRTTYKK